MTFLQKSSENVNFWLQVLFRVSSLVGIVMLPISLEREMFYKQFRCHMMIDGNTFQGNIDMQRVEGSNILITKCHHDIYCVQSIYS